MSRRGVARQCNDPSCPPNSASTSSPVVNPESTSTSSTSPVATSTAVAVAATPSSTSNAGTIAGSVIGGVVFVVLLVLGSLLFLRARKRKRTPPSSEFMNSIRAGAAPVLRLDSGAEFTPTMSEKGGGHTHYPPQNSYYSPPTKFPDELMDIPSARPSVDKPLQPQRYSAQANDAFVAQHHTSTSVGSRRELLGFDTEVLASEFARRSPVHTHSVLHFAPRFSLDDPSPLPSQPSSSPPPLYPLRRQPDPDDS